MPEENHFVWGNDISNTGDCSWFHESPFGCLELFLSHVALDSSGRGPQHIRCVLAFATMHSFSPGHAS